MKYVAIISEKIRSKREIKILEEEPTEAHVEKFNELSSCFGKFIYDMGRTDIINKSFEEMMCVLTSENIAVLNSMRGEINRLVMNYLFSFRVFLDHWATHIKRDWKLDETYIKKCKDATAYEFDNCIGYRITYRLRNYAQHCDIPISRIIGSITEDEKAKVKVFVNRDILLDDFGGWKKAEIDFLKQQEKYFEILPILESGKQAQERIQQKLMLHRFDENFIMKCVEGLELNKKYKVEQGSIAIIEYFDAEGKAIELKDADDLIGATMEHQEISRFFCEDMLKRFILGQASIKVFSGIGVLQQEKSKGFPKILKHDGLTIIFLGDEYIISENVNWVRLFEKGLREKGITKFASVYADVRFGVEELKKIGNQFERICDALYF